MAEQLCRPTPNESCGRPLSTIITIITSTVGLLLFYLS